MSASIKFSNYFQLKNKIAVEAYVSAGKKGEYLTIELCFQNITIRQFSRISKMTTPQKQLLKYENTTPLKEEVESDINGWLETKKKKQTKKFKIKKFSERSSTVSVQTTLNTLKRRKEELLKSSGKKYFDESAAETTQPPSQDTDKQTKKIIKEWHRRLPLVHVNEFITEQKKETSKTSLLQEFKNISLGNRQRNQVAKKFSLNKLKKIDKNPVFSDRSSSEKQGLSSPWFLHEKLSKNQYTGLSRKTTPFLLKINP